MNSVYIDCIKKQLRKLAILVKEDPKIYIGKISRLYNLRKNNASNDFDYQMLAKIASVKNIEQLLKYINKSTIEDVYIRWALVEVIDLWIKLSKAALSGGDNNNFNEMVYRDISDWTSQMPIGDIWGEFSRLKTEIELSRLGEYIFDSKCKKKFAERLIEKHPVHSETIRNWAINKNN